MSSHTGGYQFSHMHQSIEDMEPIDDDLGGNIFISDGIKHHEQ